MPLPIITGKGSVFHRTPRVGLWCCSVDCSNIHPRTQYCGVLLLCASICIPIPSLPSSSRRGICTVTFLGITLHEVTTGLEPPLDGIAWHQMRDGRVPPPPPELKRSDDLWTLIVEMMSGEPEARPSASQILRHPRVEEATIGAIEHNLSTANCCSLPLFVSCVYWHALSLPP